MRRFKWRLQRVLDVKKKEEQVKRAELVQITEQLSQARGELFMQKRRLEELLDELCETGPADRLDRQRQFMVYSTANDKVIKKLENQIKELADRQKAKVAEILKIKQFNEGLEKVRVEAQAAFIAEQEKLEQKQMDEMTTSRIARKMITSEEVAL